jgi:XRE family transcriptional regulator, regulator of sulfur utilization
VPRPLVKYFPASAVSVRVRGDVSIRKLLPDPIPGMEIDRMELPPGARLVGIPHLQGTTEYLTCERGEVVLVASINAWRNMMAPCQGQGIRIRGRSRPR